MENNPKCFTFVKNKKIIMFTSRKTSNGFPSHNIIGPATILTGEINSDGDFRVDGEFNGSISIKGELIVGPSGSIVGEVKAKIAEISGRVKANMEIEESVYLKSTSEVEGDIKTKKIVIEDGCVFNGQCKMITNNVE